MRKSKYKSPQERMKLNSEKWRNENPERERIRRKNDSLRRTAKKRCGISRTHLRNNKMNGICDVCGAKLKWRRGRDWTQHAVMTVYGKMCLRCAHHLEYFEFNPDLLLRLSYYLRVSMDLVFPTIQTYEEEPYKPPCVWRYFKSYEYRQYVIENTESEYDIPTAAELRAKEEAEKQGEISAAQGKASELEEEESRKTECIKPVEFSEAEVGDTSEVIQ